MKSIKIFSIAVAAAVLFAALLMPDASVRAQMPRLRIDGKENRDIYLQSLDVNVTVVGNVASTRYTMVFKNSTWSDLEAELTFPLPDGVTATHYALDVDGTMREAVPVDKAKAAQVFEEIQQRLPPIDPGILERVEGNNFRTRIYPFPRFGTRTISIGYEEELTREGDMLYYRLPMAYGAPLENFSLSVDILQGAGMGAPVVPNVRGNSFIDLKFGLSNGNRRATFSRRNFRPSGALTFALPVPKDVPQVVMENDYFLATVAPDLAPRAKVWADELAIIWDNSLSGSRRETGYEMSMLDVIFSAKKNAEVHLYYLNNRLSKSVNKKTANGAYKVVDGNWDELLNVLMKTVYDGGTDFSQIDLKNISGSEILFFSDGISTLSDVDFLQNGQAERLRLRPIHCVVSSVNADYGAMRLISGKTGGKFVNVSAMSSETLKADLLNETPQYLGAEYGKNVREVYPSIAMPVVYGNFSVAGIFNNAECRPCLSRRSEAKPMQNAEWNVKGKGKTFGADDELTLLFGFGNKVEKRIKVRLCDNRAGTPSAPAIGGVADTGLSSDGSVGASLADARLPNYNSSVGAPLVGARSLNDKRVFGLSNSPQYVQGFALPKIWAQKKIAELDLDYDNNREELSNLGKRYGIVTRNTSLMVLELIEDYIRFEIEPPPELREEYLEVWKQHIQGRMRWGGARLVRNEPKDMYGNAIKSVQDINAKRHGTVYVDDDSKSRFLLFDVSNMFGGIMEGHYRYRAVVATDYFEKLPEERSARLVSAEVIDASIGKMEERKGEGAKKLSLSSGSKTKRAEHDTYREDNKPTENVNAAVNVVNMETADAGIGSASGAVPAAPDSGISVRTPPADPVSPPTTVKRDNAHFRKLTGKTEADYLEYDDYQKYLESRRSRKLSSDFYFNAAHEFYLNGDRETALRILTSIAELDIENAAHYRMLGYRLKEYGEYGAQKFVTKKVVQWRPMEPQSYRDHALALADNGETQAALDSLTSLLKRPFPDNIRDRNNEITEAIVAEINRLVTLYPNLDISKVDPKLITEIPTEIRVVLNWNLDNVDIDLVLHDIYGREVKYIRVDGHDDIYGRYYDPAKNLIARNNSGYGPEQILLNDVMTGRYHLYARFRDSREFAKSEPLIAMAEIYTKYAGKNETRRVVSIEIPKRDWSRGTEVFLAEIAIGSDFSIAAMSVLRIIYTVLGVIVSILLILLVAILSVVAGVSLIAFSFHGWMAWVYIPLAHIYKNSMSSCEKTWSKIRRKSKKDNNDAPDIPDTAKEPERLGLSFKNSLLLCITLPIVFAIWALLFNLLDTDYVSYRYYFRYTENERLFIIFVLGIVLAISIEGLRYLRRTPHKSRKSDILFDTMAAAIKENTDKFAINKDGVVVDVNSTLWSGRGGSGYGAEPQPVNDNGNRYDDDDDDDETPKPMCTDEELAEKCRKRDDIFRMHRNRKTKYVTIISLILAITAGLFISSIHTWKTEWRVNFGGTSGSRGWGWWNRSRSHRDFYVRSDDPSGSGGGAPSARVTYKRSVAIVTDRIKSYSVVYDGTEGVGGYAEKIDGLLLGKNGLRGDGGSNPGLRVAAGIGLGKGINSGFGGDGGCGDLQKTIECDSRTRRKYCTICAIQEGYIAPQKPSGYDDAASDNTAETSGTDVTDNTSRKSSSDDDTSSASKRPTNGRDRGDIQRVIVGNAAAMRSAYNARLREAPELSGSVSVKFAIDEHGAVVLAQVMESTMNDTEFENTLIDMIRKWEFGSIDKPGDITEVTYPFMFAGQPGRRDQ